MRLKKDYSRFVVTTSKFSSPVETKLIERSGRQVGQTMRLGRTTQKFRCRLIISKHEVLIERFYQGILYPIVYIEKSRVEYVRRSK